MLFPVAVLLVIVLSFLFLYLLPRKNRMRSQKILKYFNARMSWPLGTIEIKIKDRRFFISRMARGGSYSGIGGSYPILWTYTQNFPKTLLGHESSGRFTLGSFLILPPHEVLSTQDMKVLVGSEQKEIIEKLKKHLQDESLFRALQILFTREYHHLTISDETHIECFWPKPKTVLSYTSLPEAVYENPQELERYISSLEVCCEKLGIQIQNL